MTTIAWDGRMLAGDRRSTWGGTPTQIDTKLVRARHPSGRVLLVGCAGITEECHAVREWLLGQRDQPEVTDVRIMGVDDTGFVWVGSKPGFWAPVGRRPWAIGSGADYALGAMAAGKSARQAVLIASRLDTYTGDGVTVLRLVGKSDRRA